MARNKKRYFKKKEDPFAILNHLMQEMDFIEEAIPGMELNQELPVKSDDMDRFMLEFQNTELADEIMVIQEVIKMYEEFKRPDEEDLRDVLVARERIKMMCEDRCADLSNLSPGKQYGHYKRLEESLEKALFLNRRAMQMADKYGRQKECKNIDTCSGNYLKAVYNELRKMSS